MCAEPVPLPVQTHQEGVPVMRAMALEFFGDRACEDLDRQYMLGDSLLVAPIFRADNVAEYYLPDGMWTHLLSGEIVQGGKWWCEAYDFFSLPLFVREHTLLPMGDTQTTPEYDYLRNLTVHAYALRQDEPASVTVWGDKAQRCLTVSVVCDAQELRVTLEGSHDGLRVVLHGAPQYTQAQGATLSESDGVQTLAVEAGAHQGYCR